MIWSARSTPLNALPLLSFHKVHIRHKGAPPRLHPSFTHKRVIPSKQVPPHGGMQNPLHTEKGEDQIPQHTSLVTKQKKKVISFFFFFTQETSI